MHTDIDRSPNKWRYDSKDGTLTLYIGNNAGLTRVDLILKYLALVDYSTFLHIIINKAQYE